jgi:hypothetical protein
MKQPKQKCDCGRVVVVSLSARGGRYESSSYAIKCVVCGVVMDHLPSNCSGRKADAIAEWNRIQKKKKCEVAK